MRNFFERRFGIPNASSENHEQEDQPPDPDKRKTLRKLFKIGAVAATAPFVEPLLKVKDAFSQIESGEIKEIKDGINYASLEAQEKLKGIERIFKAVELDKALSPIIIGISDDFWRSLSKEARVIRDAIGKATGEITAAFAFTANDFLENYPDLAKKLDVKPNYVYMIFNVENFEPEHAGRYAVHECLHAKHFANRLKEHPEDKIGYLRHPEMSSKANAYLEEVITDSETIDFFENQVKNPADSILTSEEEKEITEIIEKEKEYFLRNYLRYYLEKYPRDKFKFFAIPHGEQPDKHSSIDQTDKQLEKLYRKHNIIETLTRVARSIE